MFTTRTFRTVTRLALIASLVFSPIYLTRVVSGQTTRATVLGIVKDEKGASISKSKVAVKNVDTGLTREAAADDEGRYRVSELPPGIYEVRAEHQGFAPELRSGIDLTVGRDAVVDFTLKVGGVQESAIIVGDAPLIDTTSSAVGFLVNTKQIEELPLNGRDVLQLATLNNGVISTGATAVGQAETGPGRTLLSVNGGRIDFNTYYLDGTQAVDGFGNSPGGLGGGFLGVDALREFEVLTSNYSAEYAQAGGAVINAVTKSGTNDIHGTAFEFLRNSALDARNFFNANKLPFKRNQFGGSVGGPIVKNKTFFFANYEGLRRSEESSGIFFVPSPAARAGKLTTGQIAIPASVVSYVNLYPAGNGPIQGDTQVFRRDANATANEDFFVTRIDHTISPKHSMFGRYEFDGSSLGQPSGVITNQNLANRNQFVTLEEQWLISPRALNTIRAGYSRGNFGYVTAFDEPVDSSLGFIPGHPMGAFNLGGVSPLRGALEANERYVLNTPEVSDQLIYNRGSHSLKIGGVIRRYQLNADSPLLPDGIFLYFGGLGSFLAGKPGIELAAQPGTNFYRGIRETLFGLYVQDDWKVRSNLTLNLGLRYEPTSTPNEANGKLANLRAATDAKPTVGEPFILNPSKHNFAPRVGFAWDVTGSGKWSVRAGFGAFYAEILPMKYRFEMSNQPPFANLLFLPGIFPNGFQVSVNNPIPAPGLLWFMQNKAEQPTVYQWNFNVQHQVGDSLTLTAGYVGSRGVHLSTGGEINIRTDSQIVNGQKFFPASGGTKLNPHFGMMQFLAFRADSKYNGLQLSATKRYSHGVLVQAQYTFSRSIDDASSNDSVFQSQFGSSPQDPFNIAGERGLSSFDIRHNFVANLLWDLPIGPSHSLGGSSKGFEGKLLGGWQLGGILSVRSGFPFTLGLGIDRARNGISNVQSQRPNVVPGRSASSSLTGNPNGFVDSTAFQLQPEGFYGNLGRNTEIGPGLRSLDFAVQKKTSITERLKTEFRFEAFNITNHTNFANPLATNLVIFDSVNPNGTGHVPQNFGQLTATATSSRQLQFGLKFIW
jgi:hypothetical protein